MRDNCKNNMGMISTKKTFHILMFSYTLILGIGAIIIHLAKVTIILFLGFKLIDINLNKLTIHIKYTCYSSN